MKSTVLVIVVLLLCVSASAQTKQSELAELNVFDNFLFADGVWRADNLDDKTEAAIPSVTRLECYKHGGRDIVNSDAYCMEATAQIAFGNPVINVTYYPVLKWDKEKVIAAESSTGRLPICAWTQITVNLQDHSIMATDTRKLGEGHEGFNNVCEKMPLAQTYHLMDEVQEFTRRQLREDRRKSVK